MSDRWSGVCEKTQYRSGRFVQTFFFIVLEGEQKLPPSGTVVGQYRFEGEPKRDVSLLYLGVLAETISLAPNVHGSVVVDLDGADIRRGAIQLDDPELMFGFLDEVWDGMTDGPWVGARALTQTHEAVFLARTDSLDWMGDAVRERLELAHCGPVMTIEFEYTRMIRPGFGMPPVFALKQRVQAASRDA